MVTNARILVVDDEEINLDFYRFIFEREGYEVHTVQDSRKAVDAIDLVKPDVIISDIIMPGIHGLELLAQSRHFAPNVPVIFVSSKGSNEYITEAKTAGAAHFFVKPVKKEALCQKIQEILSTE